MSYNAGSIVGSLGIDINPFAKGMLQASGIMSVFPQTVTNLLANPILGAIGVAQDLAGAIGGAINEGIKLAAANEQVAISYEVMLGSAEKAKALMDEIRQFANTTPFRLDEINNAGKQLLAFGFEGEKVIPTLRRLGDISAGLNIPLNDLAYLFGTTAVNGRLMAQDLNQFTSRGIPMIAELSKQFGVTEGEVRDLVSAGKVGFAEVEEAIRSLTDEGGKFHNLTQRQADSAAGAWSNLQEAVDNAKMSMGQAVLEGLDVKNVVKDITAVVDDMKPVVSDLVRTAVEGLKVAMPLLKETLQTVRDMSIYWGLADVNKMHGNPYQQKGKGDALGGLDANSMGADQLKAAFDAYEKGLKEIDAGYAAIGKKNPVIGAGAAAMRRDYSELRAEIDQLQKQSREGVIDEEAFKRAVAETQKLIDRFQKMREALITRASKEQTDFLGDNDLGLELSEAVRKASAAAGKAEGAMRGGQSAQDDRAEWTAAENRTREAAEARAAERAKAFDEEMEKMIDEALEEAFAPELQPAAQAARPRASRPRAAAAAGAQAGTSQLSLSSIDPAISSLVLSFDRGGQQLDRAISDFVKRIDESSRQLAAAAPGRGAGDARGPQIDVDVDVPIDPEALAKVLSAKITPHVNQVVRSQVNRLAEATRQQMYAQSVKEGL